MIKLGSKKLSRVMSASGSWAVNYTDLEAITKYFKTIVSKTCTLNFQQGNEEPNYINIPEANLALNCMGMPNWGYEYYRNMLPIFRNRNITYILSVNTSNSQEMNLILEDYNFFVGATPEIVELNLSCPNLHSSSSKLASYCPESVEELLGQLRYKYKNLHFGLKLSPYLDRDLILKIASKLNNNATYSNNITHIICSNTIPNGLYLNKETQEPHLSAVYGGISGFPLKLISLSNVSIFRKILDPSISIIGCGGIENAKDIIEYYKVGAVGVQIGNGIKKRIVKNC